MAMARSMNRVNWESGVAITIGRAQAHTARLARPLFVCSSVPVRAGIQHTLQQHTLMGGDGNYASGGDGLCG